jgi:phosphate:Na+ symporter
MIKNGVSRAYGTNLRQIIVKGTKNRFQAMLSGMAVTAVMQSSIATTMIVVSFFGSGFITLSMALAVIIGADISTSLLTQVLVFDLHWLSPVLLSVGIITYKMYERSGRERHIARVFIGIGLLTLSLTLIREILEPLKGSQELAMILAPLEYEPLLALVMGLIITMMLHSSLAAILVFSAFAGHHLIAIDLGLYLVLGANIGSAMIPFMNTRREGNKVRQLTIANLIMRGVTVCVCLAALPFAEEIMNSMELAAGRQLVDFHVFFNIVMAIIFLPLVGVLARRMEQSFVEDFSTQNAMGPQYLDKNALRTPVIALACAARETLRMAEIVERMLAQTILAFEKNDDRLIQSIHMMDNQVDLLNREIKLYLTHLSQESFDPKEADRYLQILTFSTNLEYCGDVIDKSILDLAEKKMRNQDSFSEKGFAEIKNFHAQVIENLKLAQNIFLSEDPELARTLVDKKKIVREAETETSRLHFKRLHERQVQSIATSSMHLDLIRDLRRINSYITSVAYAIIESHEKHGVKRRKKRVKAALPAPPAPALLEQAPETPDPTQLPPKS